MDLETGLQIHNLIDSSVPFNTWCNSNIMHVATKSVMTIDKLN